MRLKKLKVLHKLFATLVEQGADPIGLSHELAAVEALHEAGPGHCVDTAALESAFVWDLAPQGHAYWADAYAAYQRSYG